MHLDRGGLENGSLGAGRWRGLLARCAGGPAFFSGGLAITFLQVRKNNRENEFLFPVLIPLNADIFLVAGEHATQPELGMLNLGPCRESRFCRHRLLPV